MTSAENNPIGYIQEICQKYGFGFPQYEEVHSSGPDHGKEFTFKCSFRDLEAHGTSRQKKQAKSESARKMIELINEKHYCDKFSPNINNNSHDAAEGGVIPEHNVTFSESKNPISALNEFCQKNSMIPPQFVETSAASTFVCECKVRDKKTYGHGSNKKSAKTEAAFKMCIEFGIKCNSADYFCEHIENFQNDKNPVSALHELCSQNSTYKTPEYTELPLEMNLFVVKCTVNSISFEGKGTTKKIAKTEAARQVLSKLLEQRGSPLHANGKVEKNTPSGAAEYRVSNGTSPSAFPVNTKLEPFNLDSSEEEEEKEEKVKATSSEAMDLKTKFESLHIEAQPDFKGVPVVKSEDETSQAQEVPVESSSSLS